jgi:4-amino-4-deoxy-L-arabinose transferase-like glycosyltransferase
MRPQYTCIDNKTTALIQTTGGKDEPNKRVCSIRLYLQLFVGGLLSYLHYLCLFGSSLPPVVCRRAVVLFTLFVNKTTALLQTTGGKDEPNKHK